MAIFQNPAAAEVALPRLVSAGFSSSDVIAADGEAVLEFDEDETDLARFIMRAVSRFFATEHVFADDSLEEARSGAGFLAVRDSFPAIIHYSDDESFRSIVRSAAAGARDFPFCAPAACTTTNAMKWASLSH